VAAAATSAVSSEASTRLAADVAIIASGAEPANVGLAPLLATGGSDIKTVAAHLARVDVDGGPIPVLATGATTARTMADVAADSIHAAGHAAAADWNGSTGTDNTLAIQAAIEDAYARGGKDVILPEGDLMFRGTLHLWEGCGLVGAGPASTFLRHRPSSAGTDAVICERNPAGPMPSYGDVYLGDFSLEGDRVLGDSPPANSNRGISFDHMTVSADRVRATLFGAAALDTQALIASKFNHCKFGASDYGVYMSPTGDVSTTTVFSQCYFSGVSRVCASVNNATGVYFVDQCVFESCSEDAIEATSFFVVDAGYFENCTRSIISTSATFRLESPQIIGGGYNDKTYDLIRITGGSAFIDLPGVVTDKASLVRTFTGTKHVWVRGGAGNRTGTSGARASSHAYAKGTVITVTCDDAISRLFICSTAGTSAGTQPAGYVNAADDVTDGGAHFRSYQQFAFFDPTHAVLEHTDSNDPGRVSFGKMGFQWTEGDGSGTDPVRWNWDCGFSYAPGDLLLGRYGGARLMMHCDPGDRLGLGGQASSTHTVKSHGQEVVAPSTYGREAFRIQQLDTDQAMMDLAGNVQADLSGTITTRTTATVAGFVKVEINGTPYWMPYYNDPT
jgi:hypothetical protein